MFLLFVDCSHINAALEEFKPNLVVYNAGTDILLGDPLGRLDITPKVRNCLLSRSILNLVA